MFSGGSRWPCGRGRPRRPTRRSRRSAAGLLRDRRTADRRSAASLRLGGDQRLVTGVGRVADRALPEAGAAGRDVQAALLAAELLEPGTLVARVLDRGRDMPAVQHGEAGPASRSPIAM